MAEDSFGGTLFRRRIGNSWFVTAVSDADVEVVDVVVVRDGRRHRHCTWGGGSECTAGEDGKSGEWERT